MSNIKVFLDKTRFNPGNIITGKAVCYFRSSKEFRKIRIRLEGREHTQWTGTESYYDSVEKKTKFRSVTYEGDHEFLLRDVIVRREGTLGAGTHTFPFEFLLPSKIPGSFNHRYGDIKYSVKATVDIAWATDFESEHEIKINSPIDLQRIPNSFLEPAELSDDKTVCCFCCASGPVQLDVNLDKRAFVVGENPTLKVYCLNMSNVNVESIEAVMEMKIKFKTTRPSIEHKEDSELVARASGPGVGAHGENNYILTLEIPRSTVVPNFVDCELFHCEISLKITAEISGCHSDLDVNTNVRLGHVPHPRFDESAPPYLAGSQIETPMPMQMPMPMPMPGFKVTDAPAPPYPVPGYPSGPSAPLEVAPSAPPKLNINSSGGYEPPPPTYDEAAKNF